MATCVSASAHTIGRQGPNTTPTAAKASAPAPMYPMYSLNTLLVKPGSRLRASSGGCRENDAASSYVIPPARMDC